jgi:excisionase family DNA binding protein
MPPAETTHRYHSLISIADRFEISKKTVWRWVKAGHLKAHLFGGQLRVSEADLAAFIALRRR